MNHQTNEEDHEEVVGVPENLKVAASDDLHGGGDDEDESQSDDDAGEASDGGEDKVRRGLLCILRHGRTGRHTSFFLDICVGFISSSKVA